MPSRTLLRSILILSFFTGCGPAQNPEELEAALDRVVAEVPEATVAVSIRDPATGVHFDRNGSRLFHAASTMKVPVMIEIYRRASRGDFELEDSLRVRNRFRSIVDGSEYAIGDDPEDTVYEVPGTNMTIQDLVGNMITVSSNLATNLLIEFVGPDSVQQTTERLGTSQMQTLRGVEDIKAFEAGLSNRTTSSDLALLMEQLMSGQAVGQEEDRAMIGVLLGQKYSNMIPAGLPDGVRVAHKTGSITRIHHDAAIVYPESGEPFVLVILTEGIEDRARSGALGARIADLVYRKLRPAS
jgi:beta-lactamase class A